MFVNIRLVALQFLLCFNYFAQGGPCDAVVSISTAWAGGYTAALAITVPSSISTWTLDLTFSAPLTSFELWSATTTSVSVDKTKYKLSAMSWNAVQSAGAILTGVGFNAYYPSSNPQPVVTSVLFNGANVCSSGSITTTTAASAITTTTTAATPTTRAATTTTASSATSFPLSTKYNYAEVITKSLLFYYTQRSGRLPTSDNPIPYRSDSALGDKGQSGEDLTGGYYDAGDHVKFGFPMASAATVMAWSVIDYAQGYSSAGQLTNARNAVKWATDYFIKAHVATNKFYGQVGKGDLDHGWWGRPEDMTMSRPAYFISTTAPGSDLAGETAAALAAASIVFAQVDSTYSALCLTRSKQLYAFAKQYLGKYSNSIADAANFYSSSNYGDELAWAAIWLYRATQDVAYLNEAKAHYNSYGLSSVPSEFSWDDKNAGVQVMLAKLTGETQYRNAVKSFCDSKVNQPKTPKGLLFISQWGSLRHASNIAFICLQAADLNINSLAYRQFAQKQIHYALGDTGRSFVVGFGTNPPVRPHHKSSSCANRPATCDWNSFSATGPNPQVLYGALVGGPDASDNYSDDRSNYVTNEVACDYNAGFQGAVAALQSLAVQGKFS